LVLGGDNSNRGKARRVVAKSLRRDRHGVDVMLSLLQHGGIVASYFFMGDVFRR